MRGREVEFERRRRTGARQKAGVEAVTVATAEGDRSVVEVLFSWRTTAKLNEEEPKMVRVSPAAASRNGGMWC